MLLDQPLAGSAQSQANAVHHRCMGSEPELDRDRLGFARWLVDEKKLTG